MQRQRISKELAKLNATPPHGIAVFQKDDRLDILEAKITGPQDTPYQDGLFTIQILIPEKYPFAPPSIKFITKIYHPNIDENGRICLNLLKMPPSGGWKPTIGLEGLLIAVRMLMADPNPNDPLEHDIAQEFMSNKEEFLRKAKMFTKEHASSS